MNTKDIFVIDFTSKHINFCHALCNNKDIIKIKKLVQKSYAGFIDGAFLEKELIKSILNEGISELGVNSSKIKNLYIGVPAHFSNTVCKSVTRNFIESKKITEQDLYSLYDMAENFPHENQTVINRSGLTFTLDTGEYVDNPIGYSSSSLSAIVSVVVADNEFIKTISTSLPSLNIIPQFVSIKLSELLYLLTDSLRQDNAIIIDLGFINSSVTYICHECILGLRSFSMGMGHVIGDVSQVLKINFDSAVNVLNQISLNFISSKLDVVNTQTKDGNRPISVQNTQEIVFARLDEIVKLIKHCLSSLNAVIPTYAPIYLTGESAEFMDGISDYLSTSLNKNIKILTPNVPKYNKTEYSSLFSLISLANHEEKYKQKTFWQKIFGD